MSQIENSNGYSTQLLKHKTALVTGAGKGIGRGCVTALVEAGATVIAVSRTRADLESLQTQYQNKIIAWSLDATSDAFFNQLKTFVSTQGKIDILVNNLGSNQPEPFIDIKPETYSRIMEMNFGSVFRTTQVVVKSMQDKKVQGSIINITSQMGHVGSPNRSLYCASKHAVEGLTKALAVELAVKKIRVNSVAPTFVATELTKPMLEDKDFNQFVMSKIPLQELATTDDVAAAVVYLASPLSSMVTGTSLLVDGGWVAQ